MSLSDALVELPDGWYFYDETWSDLYLTGPYASKSEALQALSEYAEKMQKSD